MVAVAQLKQVVLLAPGVDQVVLAAAAQLVLRQAEEHKAQVAPADQVELLDKWVHHYKEQT